MLKKPRNQILKHLKTFLFRFDFMTEQLYAIFMYLLMGGITTFINIFTFWLFESVFGLHYNFANIIAWIFSVLFAYVSNKLYVFESTNHSLPALLKEILSFFGFRVLSLGIDLFTMWLCISILRINPLVSKIIANLFVLILNYIFSKFFIFNHKKS